MRPCDQCGGSGGFWTAGTEGLGPLPSSSWVECARCVDMPKLPWPVRQSNLRYEFDPVERGWEAAKRGWFKPDPDSIMRWCFVHNAVCPVPEHWQIAVCFLSNFDPDEEDCDLGWVVRPTRLEVVE